MEEANDGHSGAVARSIPVSLSWAVRALLKLEMAAAKAECSADGLNRRLVTHRHQSL